MHTICPGTAVFERVGGKEGRQRRHPGVEPCTSWSACAYGPARVGSVSVSS